MEHIYADVLILSTISKNQKLTDTSIQEKGNNPYGIGLAANIAAQFFEV